MTAVTESSRSASAALERPDHASSQEARAARPIAPSRRAPPASRARSARSRRSVRGPRLPAMSPAPAQSESMLRRRVDGSATGAAAPGFRRGPSRRRASPCSTKPVRHGAAGPAPPSMLPRRRCPSRAAVRQTSRASGASSATLRDVLRRLQIIVWWSRGESNPRPLAIVRQIYMLSWLIWFLWCESRSSTLPPPRVT